MPEEKGNLETYLKALKVAHMIRFNTVTYFVIEIIFNKSTS